MPMQIPDDDGKLITYRTTEEVGEILHINPTTVRRYIQKGQLRPDRKLGRNWLISDRALNEFLSVDK